MRTVVAVTEPLVAAGPKALTQSPTARSVAAALWVALTVVEPDVVTVSVWVLGVAGFLVFDVELVWPGRPKEPPESEIPETVSVEPVTAVTLPEAMSRFAKVLRKLLAPEPEGKDGRVPPSPPPPRKAKPPPPPAPPKPLGGVPLPALPLNRAPPPVQVPVELGVVTVRLRAATVVFDFFEADPVAVTQSPTATAPTDSVTVLEKDVVPVQVTVVWPLEALCTSMLEALRAATLPVAPPGALAGAAADAGAAMATAVAAAIVPIPRHRAQRPPFVRRLVGVCMWMVPLLLLLLLVLVSWGSWESWDICKALLAA